jgi:hypothetical protein
VSGSRNFAASHQSYGVGQAGDDHAKDSVGAFASSGGFAICIAARAAASDVPARCNRDRARPRLSTVCALSDPAPREHSAGAPPVPRKLCSGGTACAVRPRAPIRPSQLKEKIAQEQCAWIRGLHIRRIKSKPQASTFQNHLHKRRVRAGVRGYKSSWSPPGWFRGGQWRNDDSSCAALRRGNRYRTKHTHSGAPGGSSTTQVTGNQYLETTGAGGFKLNR